MSFTKWGEWLRHNRLLSLLMGALCVARLIVVLLQPLLVRAMPMWAWSNNDGYDAIGINWVTSGIYALEAGVPTAVRLPLYPSLIALCYTACGDAYPLMVMGLQALLSVLTGLLLYDLLRRVFDRRAGLLGLVLFISHPQVSNFVIRCATETLFLLIIVGLLRQIVLFMQRRQSRTLLCVGIWLGAALLVRQTLAPLAMLAAGGACGWCLFSRSAARRILKGTAMVLSIAALITAPWTVRNYVQSGSFPILQTWVGQPLFQGSYVSLELGQFLHRTKTVTDLDEEALAIVRGHTTVFLQQEQQSNRPIAREVRADAFARRLAREQLLADPVRTIKATLRNLAVTPVLQMSWRSTAVLMIWNWPLLLLSLVGCGLYFVRRREGRILSLPILVVFCYLLALHSLIWPQARYVLPGIIPFFGFAAYAISEALGHWLPGLKTSRDTKTTTPCSTP